MGLQTPTICGRMAVREDYRTGSWPRMEKLVHRWADPILHGRRAANQAEWQKPENWILGFYFAPGDSRLWVPSRRRFGRPDDSARVVNFGHAAGRPAFRILLLAHAAGLVFMGFLCAAMYYGF